MKKIRIVLIDRFTGHVLNTDAKTVASIPEGTELPSLYFESLTESEGFLKDLFSRIPDLEVIIYSDEVYLKTIDAQFRNLT